ncbi:MAG: sporulation stage II, protein E [Planctomycetota bacterium]
MTQTPPHHATGHLRIVGSSTQSPKQRRPSQSNATSPVTKATGSRDANWRIDGPTSVDGQADADALTRILADATLATGTTAAAIYLLDEATEFLTTRRLFGMSESGRINRTRALRGARTDLEAMIQGVVAVDDVTTGPIDTWKFPEPYPSAICACIGEVDFPIGTLWLFSDRAGSYEDGATAAARLAALNLEQAIIGSTPPESMLSPTLGLFGLGSPTRNTAETSANDDSIASVSEPIDFQEIDESPLGGGSPASTQSMARRFDAMVQHVAAWQHRTLPAGTRLAKGWLVDGLIESPIEVAQSWHHWDVLPDGKLAMAVCQTNSAGLGQMDINDILTATTARAALQSHMAYRHRPEDAVLRVLESIWQIDDQVVDDGGRSSVSLWYGQVDAETGDIEMASLGPWSLIIASRHGYRPSGHQDHFTDAVAHPLDRRPMTSQSRLQPGEVLMVGGSWVQSSVPSRHSSAPSDPAQWMVGNAMVAALRDGKQHPLAAVQKRLADAPLRHERTAVTLHRL